MTTVAAININESSDYHRHLWILVYLKQAPFEAI